MAFLKFSRDKQGYENFYLLQPTIRGKSRPRLLYWFRTPPNVKVGRAPFDPEVRRALEAQNPDVAFDWTAIVQTPIPPADTERWRERRRVERAIRAASEAESTGDGAERDGEGAEPERPSEFEIAPPVAETTTASLTVPPGEPDSNATADPATASHLSLPAPESAVSGPAHRRRRRRRGRRKPQVPGSGFQVPGAETSAGPEAGHNNDAPANASEAPADDENLDP